MGGKSVEAQFKRPVGDVYEACRRAVADLGYTVLNSSKEDAQISFNTGRSMSSWHGQDLTVSLFTSADGTKAVVGGSLAKGGSALTGGGSQIFAWGEKKKLSEKFLSTVERILPSVETTETPSQNPQSSGSLTDELMKLTQLKEAGVLSDDEFAKAKAKLLG